MKLRNFIKKFLNSRYTTSQISGKIFLKYNPYKKNEIDIIRKKFFALNINKKKKKISKFIFQNKENATTVLKNALNNNIFSENNKITLNFLDQIYSSFAKKKYSTKFFLPMCNDQIKFAKENLKLNISVSKCKIYFIILILNNLFKGFTFGFYIFFRSFLHIKNNTENKIDKNIIFFDVELNKNDLNLIEGEEYFIIKKFYKKYRLNKSDFLTIVKPKNRVLDNKIIRNGKYLFKFNRDPYPNFKNLFINFKFIIWHFTSFAICLKDLLIFRWYNSFLFFEAVKSKVFFYNKNQVPKFFLTPYMGSIKRSLWTFDHKNLISRCFLFFYSTNGEGYETKYYKPNDSSNWGQLDYKSYLVWDKFQKRILKEKLRIEKPKINIIGPMLSSIQYEKTEDLKKEKYILIFDLIPEKFKFEYFTSYSIINGKNIVKFQNDIIEVANDLNIRVVHKLKRSRNLNKVCKKYLKNLEYLKQFNNYTVLSDKYSISELINNSSCCISFPYISAALIAKEIKKPSIYYDSSGEIINLEKKKESHGLDIINSKANLKVWLAKTMQR